MCPFCKELKFYVSNIKHKKLLSCGHAVHFKKTKSQKDNDKKYIVTEWGLELQKESK